MSLAAPAETGAAPDPSITSTTPRQAQRTSDRLKALFLLSLGAILIVSLGNLFDPIVRYDDYPALFAEPEGFWGKTLSEGRWLNYVWHLRGVVTPSWLNFVAFQAVWALLCAALATLAFPGSGRMWFAGLAALTMLVSPQTTMIAPWFNTLLPGMMVVTLYALLALALPQRSLRLLLPPFTVAAFMAYTTLPLILVLTCLLATRERSFKDCVGLCALFVGSFALALVCVYSLNWHVHGVFGVELDISRDPNLAEGLAGLMANMTHVAETFRELMHRTSFEFWPMAWYHLALLAGATVIVARHDRLEALYLWAALAMGLGLCVVQAMKFGVGVPMRAFIFAWLVYAILIVRAAERLSATAGLSGRIARNAVLLVTLSYLLQTGNQWLVFRGWQSETRAVAANLQGGSGPIYVVGDVLSYPTAVEAGIQHPLGLEGRLRLLTGRPVILCATSPVTCASAGMPDVVPTSVTAMTPARLSGQDAILFP
ncbi:MAG: hypothetical protein CML68_15125 [Rhodobacteraceae bacterium]|nr:hypothetical protein [Paracoccaceae bacterium]